MMLSERLVVLDSVLSFAVTFSVSLYLTASGPGGRRGQLQLPIPVKEFEVFVF